MAESNPTYTASDIITDVNSRFVGGTGLSNEDFLPWISYSNQKLYQKIISVGKRAKQEIFGAKGDITLTAGVLEYTITDWLPRFGGILRVDIQYGATGDVFNRATPLIDITYWNNLEDVSTSYRSKIHPLYYLMGTVIGFIPVPPSGESVQTPTARVRYVKRPQQITEVTDEIDIPYRFLYPLINYVQAKAVQRVNEDYSEASLVERQFEKELEDVAMAVADEFEEGVDGVEMSSSSELYSNPIDY